MTDYGLSNGDRARFTVEGEVHPAAGGYFVKSSGHESFVHSKGIASAEKLAPALPTTPGSAVTVDAFSGRVALLLGRDGKWQSPSGFTWSITDIEISNPKIIHDAGKGK